MFRLKTNKQRTDQIKVVIFRVGILCLHCNAYPWATFSNELNVSIFSYRCRSSEFHCMAGKKMPLNVEKNNNIVSRIIQRTNKKFE